MGERRIIVDNVKIAYEGLFDFNEFFLFLHKWFNDKNYEQWEKKNFEYDTPEGRHIEIEIEPWRKPTDYAKCSLNVVIIANNMKDVVIKKDNVPIKMNKGKLSVKIIGYLETDYQHRWEGKPYFYFIRTVIDKWVYKFHTEKYEEFVADEANQLIYAIKSFLNLYKYY